MMALQARQRDHDAAVAAAADARHEFAVMLARVHLHANGPLLQMALANHLLSQLLRLAKARHQNGQQ